jgi:RNA polymerase sigma-54 factor
MTAILKFQYDFFIDGEETSLKPMVLQDIAARTGYDVSTISRVSNSKYVETRYGIYPLKFFFSESITNIDGDEISTREVKKILQELVNAEDKRNPLNDEQLVDMLRQHGYSIARRTVAKYRDMLNIPVARLRKML